MKKQESYKVLHKEEVLHEDLSRDELFDILDDLAEKFYDGGALNPEDIVVEYDGDSKE